MSREHFANIPSYFWYLEGCQLTICIGINVACLWYVLTRLKINVYIHRILCIAITGTLICQAVNFVSLIAVNVLKTLNVTWCSLIFLPKAIIVLTTSHFTMAIAVIRYYLATKAANVEAPNHKGLKGFIAFLCILIIGYTVSFVLMLTLSETLLVSPLTATCIGRPYQVEPGTAIVLTAHISVVIGLVNDIAMARFLKRQNQVAPIEMSVWVLDVPLIARPKHQINESKMTVPVKATAIGGCLLLFLLIMFGTVLSRTSLAPLVVILIFYEIYVPLIVLVTIKSNDQKSKNAVKLIHPPIGLQFHD